MNSFLLLVSFKKSNMVVHSSPLLFRNVTFIIHVLEKSAYFTNSSITQECSSACDTSPSPAFLLSADVHYMFPVTACPALPVIFSLLIMFIVTLL